MWNHTLKKTLFQSMKDINIYLNNILDKAEEAIQYCQGISKDDFLQDDKTQSAIILKLIIIGEEAKKLTEEVKFKIDLPWRMIIGFRNMAIHEYFNIDLNQIWDTIQNDLPDLINKVKSYLN